MNTEERDQIFRKCICTYGTNAQIDVAIEEMSELTKALLKWRRAKGAELTAARGCIVDELADVRIMARQMEILFRCEDEVEKKIDFKVQRQSDRLKNHKIQSSARKTHVLQIGECMLDLVYKYYKPKYMGFLFARILEELNGIYSDDQIRPGKIIVIPEQKYLEEMAEEKIKQHRIEEQNNEKE